MPLAPPLPIGPGGEPCPGGPGPDPHALASGAAGAIVSVGELEMEIGPGCGRAPPGSENGNA